MTSQTHLDGVALEERLFVLLLLRILARRSGGVREIFVDEAV